MNSFKFFIIIMALTLFTSGYTQTAEINQIKIQKEKIDQVIQETLTLIKTLEKQAGSSEKLMDSLMKIVACSAISVTTGIGGGFITGRVFERLIFTAIENILQQDNLTPNNLGLSHATTFGVVGFISMIGIFGLTYLICHKSLIRSPVAKEEIKQIIEQIKTLKLLVNSLEKANSTSPISEFVSDIK